MSRFQVHGMPAESLNLKIERTKKQKDRNQKTRTGMIKVFGLRDKRENLSDTRIYWFVLQKIYHMYIDIYI